MVYCTLPYAEDMYCNIGFLEITKQRNSLLAKDIKFPIGKDFPDYTYDQIICEV